MSPGGGAVSSVRRDEKAEKGFASLSRAGYFTSRTHIFLSFAGAAARLIIQTRVFIKRNWENRSHSLPD